MNCETTLTRSQQRIQQLIALKRPLTEDESEELYRALHADYMHKWRAHKAKELQREAGRFIQAEIAQARTRIAQAHSCGDGPMWPLTVELKHGAKA